MSVPLPAFRRVRLTQQCVIHPQDKGGNYLPCALEDWVLFVSLAADEEKIILRTEHRCLPIEPGGALLLPPNVCHELPFVQAPCLMLGFSAADDGQAMFEFPQLQGTPAWMLLLLLYSEQTTAAARTPLLDALLMQMAPMAHGFELCAPDAAFSLATEVLQHLNLCFADELSLTELTNRFHVSTSHMIHMFKAQFGLPPIQYMVYGAPPDRGSTASAPHNRGQCGRYCRSGRHDQPQLLLSDVQASGGGIASSIPRGHWRTPGYAGLRKRLYGIERLLEKR